MARSRVAGENERTESGGVPISVLSEAEFPEDGQSSVVGADGQTKSLARSDGQLRPPVVFDTSQVRAPKFTVTKAPRNNTFLDPISRMRSRILEGKEVDAANYDLDAMRKQGFTLVASATTPEG